MKIIQEVELDQFIKDLNELIDSVMPTTPKKKREKLAKAILKDMGVEVVSKAAYEQLDIDGHWIDMDKNGKPIK